MKTLKKYILESIFDDEDVIVSKIDKHIKQTAKDWAKTHITKTKGRISVSTNGDDVIIECKNFFDLWIDFTDIPDYVKIKANSDLHSTVFLKNYMDNVMEKFMDSSFTKLCPLSSTVKSLGKPESCQIDCVQWYTDECPNLSDLREIKDCGIKTLRIIMDDGNDGTINIDGLKLGDLIIGGSFRHQNNEPELIINGKYEADYINIDYAKVKGLPKKIQSRLNDHAGLSWWNNDIDYIEKLAFNIPDKKFQEIYDTITSKKFKMPKVKDAAFESTGWSYHFNNQKDMLIALQAGYMRSIKRQIDSGDLHPLNSPLLTFSTNADGDTTIKKWVDKKGYKVINDYDLKLTNLDKMFHTLGSIMFHIFDKKDNLVASYVPLQDSRSSFRSMLQTNYVFSTDKKVIDEIKNIK